MNIFSHLMPPQTKNRKFNARYRHVPTNLTLISIFSTAHQLISYSPSHTGIQMLTLLVPILISFLLEPNQLRTSSKFCIQLHEQSLSWLMKVGPKYPQV